MLGIENKLICLKLNKKWEVIGQCIVADAIVDLAAGISSLALDIDYEIFNDGSTNFSNPTMVRPVTWDEWITLPIRKWDFTIKSVKLEIRVPTVLIAKNYDGMPMIKFGKRPSAEQIRIRDGNIDQYTGKLLKKEDMSIDHVIPKSKGGKDIWENVVLTHKNTNREKGNRLNKEVGLKLIRSPKIPTPLPKYKLIKSAKHPDWEIFLKNKK
jgi:hypothetical protein